MVCAFATYLQEKICVGWRNKTSSLLERSILLWIPQDVVKLEHYGIIEKCHEDDWLTYGALMLKRIVDTSIAAVKSNYNLRNSYMFNRQRTTNFTICEKISSKIYTSRVVEKLFVHLSASQTYYIRSIFYLLEHSNL